MNEQLRRLFPVTDEYAYLNHAAVSAPPTPVTDAVLSQISDVQKHGVSNYKKWIATKDRACADFPDKTGEAYDPAVVLDLDYTVLMPR